MSSTNAILQSEPQPILACTVSRDVQIFDLLIEDMEAALGESWGDLGFDDALAFLDQPESGSVEFLAIALDAEDEADLARVTAVIAAAKAKGVKVILITEDMIDAIRWAAGLKVEGIPSNAYPANVINISITGGATQCRPELQKAVNAARKNGTFVVAAAGNNFQKPLAEPANCDGVISVGALSAENKIENYSALDSRTTIYTTGGGPALRVSQPWAHNKLKVATAEPSMLGGERLIVMDKGIGTSFAAPVVSGFLSLWLSLNPNLKPQDWDAHVDSFVRQVPRLEKCADCNPRGLVASDILIKLSK